MVDQQHLAALWAKETLTKEEDEELERLGTKLRPYLDSTDLADLPAPDEIDPAEEDEVDPATWRRRLEELKRSRRRDGSV